MTNQGHWVLHVHDDIWIWLSNDHKLCVHSYNKTCLIAFFYMNINTQGNTIKNTTDCNRFKINSHAISCQTDGYYWPILVLISWDRYYQMSFLIWYAGHRRHEKQNWKVKTDWMCRRIRLVGAISRFSGEISRLTCVILYHWYNTSRLIMDILWKGVGGNRWKNMRLSARSLRMTTLDSEF